MIKSFSARCRFRLVFILSFSLCLILFSCSQTKNETLPNPEIKAGMAKLSGKIVNYHSEEKENPYIYLLVSNPVTAGSIRLEAQLGDDGSFYFEEIPIECNNTIGFIRSGILNWVSIGVGLVSNEETQVEFILGENNNIETYSINKGFLSASDSVIFSFELERKFFTTTEGPYDKYYDIKPEDYPEYAMNMLEKRIQFALKGSHLSKKTTSFISNDFRLFYLAHPLLNYEDYISFNYQNFKTEEEPDDFFPQKPSKSYYTFLKDFDLNNPQHLYSSWYTEVLEKILNKDILNIPSIGDTPIDEWMKNVRGIMSELVGFDKGLFYDMLVSNSYAMQLNNELKPLSNKQKENIENYFKGKKVEIAKILLRKNDEIINRLAQVESTTVNETPKAPKDKLMDAIVSKYKGKIVVVDFWATWCGPCLEAMKKYREVKSNLKGKNIVFVYITNTSSPKELWDNQIKGIGSEHYYLNGEEWESISSSEKYGFDGIPTYLIFDEAGNLKHKVTGYQGNDEMQKMIEDLL